MKTLGISQFKAQALRIVDEVAKSQESIVITKRGKPLAELIPYRNPDMSSKSGKLADTLVFEKDIVAPLGEEMWNISK